MAEQMTATESGARAGAGRPAPGVWRLDPGHAEVGFWGRHFMLTKIRGRFTGVEAVVRIGERPVGSDVKATIQMATVDSGDQTRDDHLRSSDFFDVENWPTAMYQSTGINWDGIQGTMIGDLTIRDVIRLLTLDVEFLGALRDLSGNDRAVFQASGRINREDWGLTWNVILETGGLLVSKEIGIELQVELIRQT